jgi:hypothetical protein
VPHSHGKGVSCHNSTGPPPPRPDAKWHFVGFVTALLFQIIESHEFSQRLSRTARSGLPGLQAGCKGCRLLGRSANNRLASDVPRDRQAQLCGGRLDSLEPF